jgi:hypothetical protein
VREGVTSPAPGTAVRGYLKVGGRTIVAPVRAVGPAGLELDTRDRPPEGEGVLRCLGRPGEAAVSWTGAVHVVAGGARVDWPAEAERLWPALAAMLGLAATAPFPRRALPAPPPALHQIAGPPPALHQIAGPPPLPAHSTPAGAAAPPARTTTEVLQGARGPSSGEVPRARTALVHVPIRPLVQALGRFPGELSPMVELDGVKDLHPRDVFAAHVVVGDSSVLLEGTVITVRGSRARVRLAIPAASIRALLERSA